MASLPTESSAAAAAAASGLGVGNDAKRWLRVLLVEDDNVDAKLFGYFAAALKGYEIDLARAVSSDEARELLAAERFDACVLDFWLGCESSLRLLADLSGAATAIPVLVLTSLGTPDIRRLCGASGGTQFMGKDRLSSDALEQAFERLLGGAVDAQDPIDGLSHDPLIGVLFAPDVGEADET